MHITNFYTDPEEAFVYPLHDGLVMVQPQYRAFLVVVCPDGEGGYRSEPCPKRQELADTLRITHFVRQREITLGALSCWANRRAGEIIPGRSCNEDECGHVCDPTRASDWQLVLDLPFDRAQVRESLQWLYEARAEADSVVSVGLITVGDYQALAMRCGDWSACLMQGKPGQLGNDPLFQQPVAIQEVD